MPPRAELSVAGGSEARYSPEISWPTIFFWMVCLALNSIAQRSGRVLGTKCRHQAILRSSPIVCGFDAMDMLISWVAHAYSPTTPRPRIRHGASKVLLQRFIDKEGTPNIQAIARFKAQSAVRYLAFFLGVIPQLIKLFASRGVAWSQAAGAMYLASWVLFEALVLAADLKHGAGEQITTQSRPYRQGQLVLKIWTFAAMILHGVLFSIPIHIQVEIIKDAGNTWAYYNTLIRTSIALVTYTFSLWWGSFLTADHIPSQISFQCLCCGVAFHIAFSPAPESGKAVYLTSVFVVCVGGGFIFSFFKRRRAVGVVLVILQVFNVVTQPLLLYMLMYDPAGTYQPGWVRWLG
ncbi:hypothetical protein BJX66DRAFT_318324 [Aspergillus keveii]|uniref:Uncharacterized protein n=1 Tax=Aspergillus keveii TaxID=714993 RepID=A0ABR4FJZ3_9EURO